MTRGVRSFELGDSEAVQRLCDWAWWYPRSHEGWRWLTSGAPGVGDDASAPTGWVYETDADGVLAFLGNFRQRFDYRGDTLVGASLHTLLVDPRVKGASRDLLRRFAAQDSAFVRYTFNANDRSAPIYKHFDMQPWPESLSRRWPASARYVGCTAFRASGGQASVSPTLASGPASSPDASRAWSLFLSPRSMSGSMCFGPGFDMTAACWRGVTPRPCAGAAPIPI
jgi:hypothetical protein